MTPRRIAVALLVALLVATALATPPLLRRALVGAVNGGCASCHLDVRRLRVHLFPPGVTLNDFRFRHGDPNLTAVEAHGPSLYAKVSLLPLLRGRWRIPLVRFDGLVVDVVEGDGKGTEGKGGKPTADVEIGPVEVTRARFSYTHVQPGRKARLDVAVINAFVDRFGLAPPWHSRVVNGRATGALENSGRFELEVAAKPFGDEPYVDVELTLRDHDLSILNPFFLTEEGIRLRGEIHRAHGITKVRGTEQHSTVNATYRNLDLTVKPSHKTGALAALFMNAIASMKLEKKNTGKPPAERVSSADTHREPKETVISFLLRGLKEAAMKVSSK